MKTVLNRAPWAVFAALVITSIFTLREHFSGGVITHYLLADDSMPGLSNWWGLLTVPLLALVVSVLLNKRLKKAKDTDAGVKDSALPIKRFLGALCFGLVAGLLWELGQEPILQYYILLPVFVALFVRVHWPECMLGLVLGMLYTFGGILPILFSIVLFILTWIVYQIVRGVKLLVKKA